MKKLRLCFTYRKQLGKITTMKMNRIIPVILVTVVLVTGSLVNAYSLNTSGKLRLDSKKNFLASRAESKPGNANDNTIIESYKGTIASSDVIRMDAYSGSTITPYYFHTNEIGSTTAVTDANGNVVERYKYGLYGMPTFMDAAGNVIPKSTIGNNILFQGREYEPETNFYYFRARHLDPIMGRFLQTDPMGYQDSLNLYQALNMNPFNFLDPYGLKHTKEQIDELMRVRRDKGIAEARNWIDKNTSFTNEDRLALHMKLLVGVYDPEKVEAEKYKTNWWTVMWDTIDGVGYDVAGKTYDKLADAALNRNSGSFLSFMFDLAIMGGGGGVLKHYIPIGIDFLKGKFPILDKSVGELVKTGTKKVKNFFDKIFGRGQTSASGTTIATEGGTSLPFKNPGLKDQIETVIESFDETGKPPSGVWQGGRRGQPRGLFLNDKGKLPTKPHGYYTESDVWPGSPGNRNAERLIFGKGGEVYYTADHYKTFVRIR
jgi:RHS repeat-associated protein